MRLSSECVASVEVVVRADSEAVPLLDESDAVRGAYPVIDEVVRCTLLPSWGREGIGCEDGSCAYLDSWMPDWRAKLDLLRLAPGVLKKPAKVDGDDVSGDEVGEERSVGWCCFAASAGISCPTIAASAERTGCNGGCDDDGAWLAALSLRLRVLLFLLVLLVDDEPSLRGNKSIGLTWVKRSTGTGTAAPNRKAELNPSAMAVVVGSSGQGYTELGGLCVSVRAKKKASWATATLKRSPCFFSCSGGTCSHG